MEQKQLKDQNYSDPLHVRDESPEFSRTQDSALEVIVTTAGIEALAKASISAFGPDELLWLSMELAKAARRKRGEVSWQVQAGYRDAWEGEHEDYRGR